MYMPRANPTGQLRVAEVPEQGAAAHNTIQGGLDVSNATHHANPHQQNTTRQPAPVIPDHHLAGYANLRHEQVQYPGNTNNAFPAQQQWAPAPQNLAPPPVQHHNWQNYPVYNTLMDLPVIPTPGGTRQIQGWFPFYGYGQGNNLYNNLNGANLTSPVTHPLSHQGAPRVLPDPFGHLDLANFLPPDVIAKIRARQYVDFAKLLQANMEDPVAEVNTQQVANIGGSVSKLPQRDWSGLWKLMVLSNG